MSAIVTILAVIVGGILFFVFVTGILAGTIGSIFNFLKGIFDIGQGCAKGCRSILLLVLVTAAASASGAAPPPPAPAASIPPPSGTSGRDKTT